MVFLSKNRGADGDRKPVAGARAAGRGVFGAVLLTATLLAFGMSATASAAAATSSLSITSPVDRSLITESTFPLSFTTSGIASPRVICLVDGRVVARPLFCDPASGLARLPNGFHRIKLIAHDTAGSRQVASRTVSITVADALQPELTSTLADGATVSGPDFPLGFTSLGGAVYECRIVGGGGQACGPEFPAVDPELGFFMPRALVNGPLVLGFESTDVNRRTGSLAKPVVVDDHDPAAFAITSPAAAAIVDESPMRLGFEIGGEYARVVCRIDGGPVVDCAGDGYIKGGGNTRLLPLANGTHNVELTAVDLVGNTASVARSFVVDDQTAPVVTINSPSAGHVYGDESLFELAAHHSPGIVECRFRPADFANCGDAAGMESVSSADSAGEGFSHPGENGAFHVLDMRVTDPEGRQTQRTVTFGIDDTTPPDAFFVSPTVERVARWFPVLLSEYGDRSRCTFAIDDGRFAPCDEGRGLELVETVGGEHMITVRVVDGVGNTQSLVKRVLVEDPESGAAGAVDVKGSGPSSASATIRMQRSRILARPSRSLLRVRGYLHPSGTANAATVCGGKVRLSLRLTSGRIVARSVRTVLRKGRCRFAAKLRLPSALLARRKTVLVVARTTVDGHRTAAKRRYRVPARLRRSATG